MMLQYQRSVHRTLLLVGFALLLVPLQATASHPVGAEPTSLGNETASSRDRVSPTPPTFSKAFAPATVLVCAPSTITYAIDAASGAPAASALAFVDTLPSGLTIGSPANSANSCGGTLTAGAGTAVISLSGGAIGAGGSCAISVDVVGAAPGTYTSTSGDLTSSEGNSGSAASDLVVVSLPGFTKSFAPDRIPVGGSSTLTFIIDNSANSINATGLSFTDNLPTGMLVATPANGSTTCSGGTLTAVSGSGVVSYSGGTVPTASSCSISVDVTVTSSGTLDNVSGPLTSSLGSGLAATATDSLAVDDAIEVPTLSQAGLVLLCGLLALLALGVLRRRQAES